MENRKEWEFEYTAADLATAARSQFEYRLGRVRWWQEARETVMHEIKESGIEVSESLAMGTANYTSKQLRGPQVMVRADLQDKLTEAHQKIQQHQALADEYDAWTRVLDAHPQSRLKLTAEDWRYFFGRVG